jgi:hypothetical protein
MTEKTVSTRKSRPTRSVFDPFRDTVIALPFKAANRTFMASLGLLSYAQTEFEKQYREFDRKVEQYARDGEKVVDRFEHRVDDFRKDVEKQIEAVRGRIRGTFDKAA